MAVPPRNIESRDRVDGVGIDFFDGRGVLAHADFDQRLHELEHKVGKVVSPPM
jgi:hypothetical protein